MTSILIAGSGGVGGYFGGLLAKTHYANEAVDIIFLSRGENMKVIQNEGLTIETQTEKFVVKPNLVTDNATIIGKVDFVILCTKSYDLESTIHQLKPCISAETIILPLLNGVDNKLRIKKILPNNLVLDGFVYLIARLAKAGNIINSGNIENLYFGLDNYTNDQLILLEKIFHQANIKANLSTNISTILWEKYIFLSPIATVTTYFNDSIGSILDYDLKLDVLIKLIEEIIVVAKSNNINVCDDILSKTLNKLKSLPFETTTSMHSDFQNNPSKTEVKSLTGYVVLEGKRKNLELPFFDELYIKINQ